MTVYLVRHGADDNSKRGGWSNHPLIDEGLKQSEQLARKLKDCNCKAELIVSSDLLRAKQTAEILAKHLNLKIEYISDFREVNNGDLAGMDNAIADELYPNLYWRKLEWNQHYPNGESPQEFYERVKTAWEKLIKSKNKIIILVTHGGVIKVILHLVNGVEYSNKNNSYKIGTSEFVKLNIRNEWIFFDIGSTLVDESECYEVRYKETTQGTNVSYQEFKDKVIEFATASDNPYKEAVQFFGLQKTKWYKELEKPYPFTESVLAELSKKYKLGIIANQSAGSEQRLADWGIGKYFDLVIASAEEGVEKPDPRIFETALDRANCLAENAVMVGDRIDNDILPAKKIGMKTVLVKQGFAEFQSDSDIADYAFQTLEGICKLL